MNDSLWNFIIFGVLGINSCFWVNFLPSSPLTRLSFSFQHFQQGGGLIFWLSDEVQKYESSPNSLLAHFQPSSVMEPLERIFYHFNIDSCGFFGNAIYEEWRAFINKNGTRLEQEIQMDDHQANCLRTHLLKMFSEAAYFSNFSTADKPSSGAAPQL